jgi:hypothetical protein
MDIRETDWGTLQYQDMEMTPHPQCMPEEYKEQDGFFSPEVASVRAYRKYYINDKKDIAKWNKSRPMPDWFTDKTYKVELVA